MTYLVFLSIAELVNDGMEANAAAVQVAPFKEWQELIIGVAVTSLCWIAVTFLTKPASQKTLISFYKLVKPSGPGWKKVIDKAKNEGETIEITYVNNLPLGILCMLLGCIAVYSALFSTGYWIYSSYFVAVITTIITILATFFLIKFWNRVIR